MIDRIQPFVMLGVCALCLAACVLIPNNVPVTKSFDGAVYRYYNPKYAPTVWQIIPRNLPANHRYTGPGRGALYTCGTCEKCVRREMVYYGVDEQSHTIYDKCVSYRGLLDITDKRGQAFISRKFGVTHADLTQCRAANDCYKYTKKIGHWAMSRGYRGLIVPSTGAPGAVDCIFFHSLES